MAITFPTPPVKRQSANLGANFSPTTVRTTPATVDNDAHNVALNLARATVGVHQD